MTVNFDTFVIFNLIIFVIDHNLVLPLKLKPICMAFSCIKLFNTKNNFCERYSGTKAKIHLSGFCGFGVSHRFITVD